MKKNLMSLMVLASFFCHGMKQTDNGNKLRVMTYNIRREGKEETADRLWENRLSKVITLINTVKPDIIGIQEPTEKQINDMQRSLSGYDTFGQSRGASWLGLGTDEFNPIFYNTRVLTKLDEGTFSINESKSRFGWMPWDAKKTGWLPRIATWGRFKINTTGKEFYFFNTHFDHMYKDAQLQNAKNLIDHIGMINEGNIPIIITGDFNTQFSDEVKAAFKNLKHAREIAREKKGPLETSTGWDDVKLKWIDHIIVSPSIQVKEFVVVESPKPYPSDHRAVFAVVAL